MAETLPVIHMLGERFNAGVGYVPGSYSDGFKIGACIDGGAYAAITSLGMGVGLAEEGYMSVVDRIYGLSNGAVNGAYIASGQLETAPDFYLSLADRGAWDPKRMLHGHTPMDGSAVSTALKGDAPLDLEQVLKSAVPLTIGVTNVSEYTKARVTNGEIESGSELVAWLARSTLLPLLAGRPLYSEDNTAWADGALSWSSLEQMAIDDGCTHIISLASKRYERFHTAQRLAKATAYVIGKWLEHYGRGNPEQYLALIREQASTLDWQPGGITHRGTYIERYYPGGAERLPTRSTTAREPLLRGFRIGRETIKQALAPA